MNDDIFDFLDNYTSKCVLDNEIGTIIINFLTSKGIGLKTIEYKAYTIEFPIGWMFFKIWKSEKEFHIDLMNKLSGKSLEFTKSDVQGVINGLENIMKDIEDLLDDIDNEEPDDDFEID